MVTLDHPKQRVHYFYVGVLQRSCLGRTFWWVVINDCPRWLVETEVWDIQDFADDDFIVARTSTVRFAYVLGEIHRYAAECNLEFSVVRASAATRSFLLGAERTNAPTYVHQRTDG